jgi:hypothetical protein
MHCPWAILASGLVWLYPLFHIISYGPNFRGEKVIEDKCVLISFTTFL